MTPALLLLVATVHAARAQSGPPAENGRVPSCEDTIGSSAREFAALYVVAALRPFDSTQAISRQVVDLALYEIATRFRAPTPLALRAYGGGENIEQETRPDAFGHLVVNAMYGFQLRRDGRITGLGVLTTSLNALLDQRVLEAITGADSAGALPHLLDDVRASSVQLRLFLRTKPAPDSGDVVLFRLRTPRVQFSKFVWTIPDHRNTPRYPTALRNRGVEGKVVTQFVVNRDGAVEPRTLSILHATHVEFAKEVLRVVPHFRFTPARIGSCAVAQLVQMPFEFTITR